MVAGVVGAAAPWWVVAMVVAVGHSVTQTLVVGGRAVVVGITMTTEAEIAVMGGAVLVDLRAGIEVAVADRVGGETDEAVPPRHHLDHGSVAARCVVCVCTYTTLACV